MISLEEFIEESRNLDVKLEAEYIRIYRKMQRENNSAKRDEYLARLLAIAVQFDQYQLARVLRRIGAA